MKTYAKKYHMEPFDWNKFLNRKRFTAAALDHAGKLAGAWVTCACGQQCASIPRNDMGAPIDRSLRALGLEFVGCISRMQTARTCFGAPCFEKARSEAKLSLERIEQLSAEILAEMATPKRH